MLDVFFLPSRREIDIQLINSSQIIKTDQSIPSAGVCSSSASSLEEAYGLLPAMGMRQSECTWPTLLMLSVDTMRSTASCPTLPTATAG